MKKIIKLNLILLLFVVAIPKQSFANESVNIAKTEAENKKTAENLEAKALLNRLEIIKAMDKSEMTFKEKRELRKEVKSINTSMSRLDSPVYLTVGGVIIIILLAILLL